MAQGKRQGIEYHSQDQRKHYRLTTPFWVQIEGKTYKTKDWSVGGLSISNYHRNLKENETLDLKIIIKFQGFNIGFEAQSKVISCDNNNNTRLAFYNLSERSKNILQFFSQSIISGEMADIEDTIKRIDVPINLQDDNIEDKYGKKPPFRRWPLKSIFFTVLYLSLGLIIFSYLALVLYSNFVHMKIESSVVTSPEEKIVSPFTGLVGEYYVKPGDLVKEGEPLIRIDDADLAHKLDIEKTHLIEAQNEHKLKSTFLVGEKNKVNIYENIGQTKYEEAKSNVREFTERLEHLQNEHERAKILYQKRFIAKSEMDKFEADYETVMHQLEEAKHQVVVHEKALKAVETGHYFSNDQLEGEIPQHQAYVDHASAQIDIVKLRIAALEKQMGRRVIRAPFNGHVVDLAKSNGNTVDRGEELLLLERDETRFIKSHLTQEEIVEITMDSTATVYIPSIKKRYLAKVRHIDRTDGFIDEVNAIYKPRTVNDRSALVELELQDFTMEGLRNQLPAGTPAVVYFDRSMWDGITHRIRMYFSPAHKPDNSKVTTRLDKQPSKITNAPKASNVIRNIEDPQ